MKTNIRVGLKKKRVESPNVWVSPMMLLKEIWSNSCRDSTLFFSISFFIVKCASIFVIIIIFFFIKPGTKHVSIYLFNLLCGD